MRQKRQAILVYGKSQVIKTQASASFPVIDVTEPNWEEELKDFGEDSKFFCLNHAYTVARKRYPANVLRKISNTEEIEQSCHGPSTRGAVAARVKELVVSREYNPAVEDSAIWLSTYHLSLIDELVGRGFTVEILDEDGKVVTKVEREVIGQRDHSNNQ